MAEIIRLLGDGEWQLYREVRLAALTDTPEAFATRAEDEAPRSDDFWREQMLRARRIVAERDDELVGLVGLGPPNDALEAIEMFGLWTAPTVRGERVAWDLVSAAAGKAAEEGCRLLYLWVGCDNVSAIGFASSFGFRPTDERRQVRVAEDASEEDAEEVAMVLPLMADPTQSKNLYLT